MYFARCSRQLERWGAFSVTSLRIRGLQRHTSYKARVRAWKLEDGRKTYIGRPSPVAHIITGGYDDRYCNPKAIRLDRTRLTLEVGRSRRVRASVEGARPDRAALRHVNTVRGYSSNANVATVSSRGRVKARGKGSCTIWAVANNGMRRGLKVRVK